MFVTETSSAPEEERDEHWQIYVLHLLMAVHLEGGQDASFIAVSKVCSAQNLHQLLASIPQDLLAQAAAQCVVPCRRSWCFIRQHCAHQLSPACAPAACQHPSRSTGTGSGSMCCALQALLVLHQDPPAQPSMCTSCLPASLKIYWHRQQLNVLCLAGAAGVSSGSIAPTSSAQHVHQLRASIP